MCVCETIHKIVSRYIVHDDLSVNGEASVLGLADSVVVDGASTLLAPVSSEFHFLFLMILEVLTVTSSIYIATAEPYCGKSLISLGITERLLRKTRRVGCFRPIISQTPCCKRDKNIDLLLSYFNLDLAYEDTFAFYSQEANNLIVHGRYADVLDKIIQKYKALESRCDFVLCIGSDYVGTASAFEFNINADIARNLGIPVLVVGTAANRDIESAISSVELIIDLFRERECQILGAIMNRAEPDQLCSLQRALEERLNGSQSLLSVIPETKVLSSPTIKEIATELNAEVLYCADHLEYQAFHYTIAATQIQNYLSYLRENDLVITPGDRADVILSTLQAHQSHNYPNVAGILLTLGEKPDPSITKLLDGLTCIVPILSVEMDTYETAAKVGAIHSYLAPENFSRIALSLRLFDEYVDTEVLEEKIASIQPRGVPPRMFIYNLTQKAKSDKKHIVLPEGTDERMLKAAEVLLDQNIVDITLLGKRREVLNAIRTQGRRINLHKISIVDPQNSPQFFDYVQTLYRLRKKKGLTLELARELMADVSYFGTMMVHKGDADGMVSGAVHTTQHTIRPALEFVRTKPGFSIVSSAFFMCFDDKVLVYGDCAINPAPTSEELAEIAISSADTSQAFGIEPRVAMLSYSSGESGKGEDVEKVRRATQIARERRPDLLIEGPIQYDAAVDPDVAEKKLPNSEVAGRATVLIFPDLNTGNNTYKAVQRESGAIAIGPILQGLNKPVNDLSRGATVTDVINTIIITAVQAQTGL